MDECSYCNKPGTLLCDAVIGWSFCLHEGRVVRADANSSHTCDLPLCSEHGTMVSQIFFCLSNGDGDHDTVDKCPEHLESPEERPGPMTSEEAVTERARVAQTAAFHKGTLRGGKLDARRCIMTVITDQLRGVEEQCPNKRQELSKCAKHLLEDLDEAERRKAQLELLAGRLKPDGPPEPAAA